MIQIKDEHIKLAQAIFINGNDFDNEERMIAIGNKIYYDSKYITLP